MSLEGTIVPGELSEHKKMDNFLLIYRNLHRFDNFVDNGSVIFSADAAEKASS